MNSPDNNDYRDSRTPDRLMSDAELGFTLSYEFAPHDAARLRIGAAAMFAEGAGRLLDERLAALGVTDGQIEELAKKGLLNEALQRWTPQEMGEIRRRVRRVVASDPRARSALEDEGYFIDYDQELTQND